MATPMDMPIELIEARAKQAREITELIEESVGKVKAHGFGEVVVKIKNGAVYRILAMTDTMLIHGDYS